MSSEGIDIVRMEEVLQKGPPLQAKGGVSVWTVHERGRGAIECGLCIEAFT